MGRGFEDLLVWQKARELTALIYDVSRRKAFFRDFGLRDQIRRAAVSVMSNVAEGSNAVAMGSSVVSWPSQKDHAARFAASYVAFDQGYIDSALFDQLVDRAFEVSRMLQGLTRKATALIVAPAFSFELSA